MLAATSPRTLPRMERRLAELELRYTEQQQLVEDLSAVVYRQQREIDALKAELNLIKQRLGESDPGIVDASRVDKPPHY